MCCSHRDRPAVLFGLTDGFLSEPGCAIKATLYGYALLSGSLRSCHGCLLRIRWAYSQGSYYSADAAGSGFLVKRTVLTTLRRVTLNGLQTCGHFPAGPVACLKTPGEGFFLEG